MSFLAYPTHVAWPLWSHVPIPERLHPFASLNNQVYQACAPTEILQVCQSSRSGICVLHRRLLCGGLRLGAAVRTQADWRVPLLFTLASRVYTVNGWHVCRSYYSLFFPPYLFTLLAIFYLHFKCFPFPFLVLFLLKFTFLWTDCSLGLNCSGCL